MKPYKHSIKILKGKVAHGYVEGVIGDYKWFAKVSKTKVVGGIDVASLDSGVGRITRLCIYKDSSGVQGNPYAPSITVKRYIYANYNNEWSVFNITYREYVEEIVLYLNRKFSFKLIV